jgi:hypothetical protein
MKMKTVEEMKVRVQTKPTAQGKREAILSPELMEVLHMLKALESEQAAPPAGER